MKRIIQCPQCEAKLSVFDIGKPISQKCPKCGNAINVESEEPSPDDKKDPKDASASTASAAPDKSQPAKAAAKGDKPAEAVAKGDKPAEAAAKDAKPSEDKEKRDVKKADDKEQNKTSPVRAPIPASAFDSLPTPEPAGTGGLFKAIVIGAIIIIIAMQMITKLHADKQYKNLIEHLQYIEKNLGN